MAGLRIKAIGKMIARIQAGYYRFLDVEQIKGELQFLMSHVGVASNGDMDGRLPPGGSLT